MRSLPLTSWSLSLVLGLVSAAALSACGESSDGDSGAGGDGSATGGASSGSGGASSGSGGAIDASGGADAGSGGSRNPDDRKLVVGYLPTYRSLDPSRIDFATLTHLCIAFANPTGNGNEIGFGGPSDSEINALVSAAHAGGVKVLASIAGAAQSADVAAKIVPENVDAFVASLVSFTNTYSLDGIDVDIEGNHVTWTYEPFVKKLKAALPAGKLLTAAVATWHHQDFPDGALAEYDFINLMSYDRCGSWSDACEHSTIEDGQDELDTWVHTRGIPANKMVMGVPFYGWCWGNCPGGAGAKTYADILAQWPTEARTTDLIDRDGYYMSYNSPPTIAAKAELAKSYAGIMIWELGQDASGDDALFKVIADAQ